MKILIGTPIHECKNYSLERWLLSVSKLEYPHDLLLIDNSPGVSYVEKLKRYCEKYKIKNYRIEHIEFPYGLEPGERIARSREIIRQEIIKGGHDAWCSLESDIIAPPNAINELVRLIGDFMVVNHIYPQRELPEDIAPTGFGLSLIKREALIKYGFILDFNSTDPEMPRGWHGGERWFMRRIIRGGDKTVDVYGIIKPIYHLDKPLKLHLGCGGNRLEDYINIDIRQALPEVKVDLFHDFRTPLPYKGNSVDEIYSRDLIQHFSRKEWQTVKKDWVRVLKPNGVLSLHCHDFEYVLNNFLAHPDNPYWLQAIYAGQDNEFDYFKNGFTYEKLVADLKEEGMTDFQRNPDDTRRPFV